MPPDRRTVHPASTRPCGGAPPAGGRRPRLPPRPRGTACGLGSERAAWSFSRVARTNLMCGARVRERDDMVTVTFLSSVQDFQEGRIQEVAERLRKDHADWKVEVVPPEGSKPLLAKYKLQFGPAILVNDRIEFVGIPRYRMLVERVSQVAVGRISPRTAQPPPAAAPAATAKPAVPPSPTPPPR